MTPFVPSPYGFVPYGASSALYPCIQRGATDKASKGAVSAVQRAINAHRQSKSGAVLESSTSPMDLWESDPAQAEAQAGWISLRSDLSLGVSGVFDSATDLAVRSFQGEKGLATDGTVGPVTGAALGLSFQNCSGGFRAGGAGKAVGKAVDQAGSDPTLMDKVRIFALTQPELLYGGLGMVAVLSVMGVVYYRNKRG
jgi:peptidoglycan hydrolase-like protein with peptidoglycan-binding domain